MASLTEKRDIAASKLTAKQETFDSSLAELEAKLTALLKRKIEATYAEKMRESALLLAQLNDETAAQDVDLEALRKMYAELVARLEQQRSGGQQALNHLPPNLWKHRTPQDRAANVWEALGELCVELVVPNLVANFKLAV